MKGGRRNWLLRIAMAAVVTAAVWLFLSSRQPSYQGKSLEQWIYLEVEADPAMAATRTAALAAMSPRAIPMLIERLRWKPSQTLQDLYRRFPNFPPLIRYVQGGSDPRGEAARFLGELGPSATNAIPELMRLSSTSDLGSSWHPRMCAKAALIKIRGESLEPAIEKLKVTSQNQTMELDDWWQNAMMISEFGPAASNAVPNLLRALNPTNHSVIQAHAIIALGRIRCQPEIVVSAVTPFLRSPDIALRQKAVFALAQFGTKSRPARDELVRSLSDADYWTRFSASNVLKVIDAEKVAGGSSD